MKKVFKCYVILLVLCANIIFLSKPIYGQNFSSSTENPVIIGVKNQTIGKFKPFLPEKLGEMKRTSVKSTYSGVMASYAGGKIFSEAVLRITAPSSFSLGLNNTKLVEVMTSVKEKKAEMAAAVGKENTLTKNGRTYYFMKRGSKKTGVKKIGFSYFGPWTVMVGGALPGGSSRTSAENQDQIIKYFESLKPEQLITLESMGKANVKGKIKFSGKTGTNKIEKLSFYSSIEMPGVSFINVGNETLGFMLSNVKAITNPGTYKLVNGMEAKDSDHLIGAGIAIDDWQYTDKASGTLTVAEIGKNSLTGSFEITASDKNTPEQTITGSFVIPFSHRMIKN